MSPVNDTTPEHPGNAQVRIRNRDLFTVAEEFLRRFGTLPSTEHAIVYELTTQISMRELYQLLQMPSVVIDGKPVWSSEQRAYALGLLADVGERLRFYADNLGAYITDIGSHLPPLKNTPLAYATK